MALPPKEDVNGASASRLTFSGPEAVCVIKDMTRPQQVNGAEGLLYGETRGLEVVWKGRDSVLEIQD